MRIRHAIETLHAELLDLDAQRTRIQRALEALGEALPEHIVETPRPTAPPPSAAAKQPAAKPGPKPTGKIWTDERRALLREHYPLGTPTREIHAMVSALPGPLVKFEAVAVQASELNLKRPAGFVPVFTRHGQLITPAALPAIPADANTIAKWADAQGINSTSLSDINAQRISHGLPPFRVGREPLSGGHNGSSLGDGAFA